MHGAPCRHHGTQTGSGADHTPTLPRRSVARMRSAYDVPDNRFGRTIERAVVSFRRFTQRPEPTRYWRSKPRRPAVCVWSRTSYPVQVQVRSLPLRVADVKYDRAPVWSGDSVKTLDANVRWFDER